MQAKVEGAPLQKSRVEMVIILKNTHSTSIIMLNRLIAYINRT